MKISINKNAFLKALLHCNSVIERRTTIPVLANILISADNEEFVSFSATDLEISVIGKIPAQIENKGKVTVSGKILLDIVKKLPDQADIVLMTNEECTMLVINSGYSHFELPILPADSFPDIQVIDLPSSFILPSKILLEMFNRTSFAMSTEETRYYLNGVFMHANNNKLCAVATDGHRMACMKIDIPSGAENIPGIIIARKTVNQIHSMASGSTSDIKICLSDTQISIQCDNFYLISRLIDGNFPDYEKIIPSNPDKIVTFDFDNLATVVDRVSTLASEKTYGVKLSISKNKINFYAENSGIGIADEEMPIEEYHGKDITIGFNSRYLLDISEKIKENKAEMRIVNESSPVIISCPKDTSATYIIMPMRI